MVDMATAGCGNELRKSSKSSGSMPGCTTKSVPFMYSHVVECHNGGKPLMRPLGKSNSAGVDQGDFHYLFGDDFLIVPIHEDKLERTVKLPAGKWRHLFDDQTLIEGPTTITRDFSLEEFPIYIREGSVVPLDVSRPYTGLGDKDSAGLTTWNIYPADGNRFTLHRPDGSSSTAAVEDKDKLAIALTARRMPICCAFFSTRSRPPSRAMARA